MGRTMRVLRAVPQEESWLGASRQVRLPPWKNIFPENQEWPTEWGKNQRTNGISWGNGARKAISFSFGFPSVWRTSRANLSLYFECHSFWGLLLDSYYRCYAFLVNIYSAKLSHVMSDEQTGTWIFGSDSRFAANLIFCRARILERVFEMHCVTQVASIALSC